MGGRRHPYGCTCRTHVDRPWARSEHWTVSEIEYLEDWFGQRTDVHIARRLGRTVVGIRLKAKRLGLHKREAGFTARSVAAIFGVDSTVVAKHWIRRGHLTALRIGRGRPGDPRPVNWLVSPRTVERFIVERPELVDVDKMPPSPYRDLAARDPWISLPEVHRRTGRMNGAVIDLILAGTIRGRKRGQCWYVPEADVAKVRPLRSVDAIEYSVFCRESVLERRRNRRKGVAA